MCDFRYVWQNLELGYIQGMCDLLAPLLVVFDDGKVSISYFVSCVILFKEDNNYMLFCYTSFLTDTVSTSWQERVEILLSNSAGNVD